MGEDLEFTEDERNSLHFYNDLLYGHPKIQFNFTTYDVRRERSVVNPDTAKRCVMLANGEDEGDDMRHPFWYARVLAVFHVKATHEPSKTKNERIDVLFVRWLGIDPEWNGGDSHRRLDRVGYVPYGDSGSPAFGFVDPNTIIRACHLIPAFHLGRTTSLLPPSRFRDEGGDFVNYYINR